MRRADLKHAIFNCAMFKRAVFTRAVFKRAGGGRRSLVRSLFGGMMPGRETSGRENAGRKASGSAASGEAAGQAAANHGGRGRRPSVWRRPLSRRGGWLREGARSWAPRGSAAAIVMMPCAAALSSLPLSPAKAQAEGMPVWSGFRAEVRAGLDHVSFASEVPPLNQGKSGVMFGVGAGYDWALGNRLLAGVEVGLDAIDTRRCAPVLGNDRGCAKSREDMEAGVRFGILAGRRLLLYAKAGYAAGRVALKYQHFTVPQRSYGDALRLEGLRLGAGAEVQFNRDYYAKVEYRRTDYDHGVARRQAVLGLGMRF